jgi:hypothetical protein
MPYPLYEESYYVVYNYDFTNDDLDVTLLNAPFPYDPEDGYYLEDGDAIRVTATGKVSSTRMAGSSLTFDFAFGASQVRATVTLTVAATSSFKYMFEFLVMVQSTSGGAIATNGALWTDTSNNILGPNNNTTNFDATANNNLVITATFDPAETEGLDLLMDQCLVEYLETPISGSGQVARKGKRPLPLPAPVAKKRRKKKSK